MKSFLLRVFLFCFCFFCIDRLFIVLRNFSPSVEVDSRLEMVVTGKLNADLLIFGSSRGARDLIAEQISKETGLSSYNLSYPASDISFHEFMLRQVIKNKNIKPKIAVLSVDDYFEFLPNKSIKFRLDRLYPLVKYKTIREELIQRGEKSWLLSQIFIFHQLTKSNFDIRKKQPGENDTILQCGSMPYSYQSRGFQFIFKKNDFYDSKNEMPEKVNLFTSFLSQCKLNNIKLIICFPPNFQNPNAAFEKRILSLSVSENIYYFHYDTTKIEYRNPDYFYDNSHLNVKGAKIFSNELSHFILKNNLQYNRSSISALSKCAHINM